jgi:hypothetical protein
MQQELTTGPGTGERWERLAGWLREQLDVGQVDGIWVFRVVRRDKSEFGTAVLSLIAGDRRRILTARYVATIKGRERGEWHTELSEVGSGPIEALQELLALVPIRADDEDAPAPVEVRHWFPPLPDPIEEVGDAATEATTTEDDPTMAAPDGAPLDG